MQNHNVFIPNHIVVVLKIEGASPSGATKIKNNGSKPDTEFKLRALVSELEP